MNSYTIDLSDPYIAGLLRRAEDAAERDAYSCVVRPAVVGWRVTTAESERFWAQHGQRMHADTTTAGEFAGASD
jgi:hypothetical protein